MDKLQSQLSKFNRIDLWAILKLAIKDRDVILLELVKNQLKGGKNKYGDMPEYESQSYIDYKDDLNRLTAGIKINLWDEGDFHDNLKIALSKEMVEIFSTDSKAGVLEDEYGSQIYELNQENMEKFKAHVFPVFIRMVRSWLGY